MSSCNPFSNVPPDFDLLADAIDVHVHTAPDLVARYTTDLALAQEVLDAPTKGIVIKSHVAPTVGRAKLVNDAVGADVLHGGITLNGSVGGVNPSAVEVALELGAAIIWFPTAWSANHASQARASGEKTFVGQRIPGPDQELNITEDGQLSESAQRVIQLAAEHDAVIGTGHLGVDEIQQVVSVCAEADATCLVNHPFFRIVDLPIDIQVSLGDQGAIMEYCAYSIKSTEGHTIERVVEAVRRIGPESCLLATDFGQADNPPVDGLAKYATAVKNAGLSHTKVCQLVAETPVDLLGI